VPANSSNDAMTDATGSFKPSDLIDYSAEYLQFDGVRERIELMKWIFTNDYPFHDEDANKVLNNDAIWKHLTIESQAIMTDKGPRYHDIYVAFVEWLDNRGFKAVQLLCPMVYRNIVQVERSLLAAELIDQSAYTYLTMDGPWKTDCDFKWAMFFKDDDDMMLWLMKMDL
jgi:hypothetical protein